MVKKLKWIVGEADALMKTCEKEKVKEMIRGDPYLTSDNEDFNTSLRPSVTKVGSHYGMEKEIRNSANDTD